MAADLEVPAFVPSERLLAAQAELVRAIERHGALGDIARLARQEIEGARAAAAAAWRDEPMVGADRTDAAVRLAREREQRSVEAVRDLSSRMDAAARLVESLERAYLALVREEEEAFHLTVEATRERHRAHVEAAREEVRARQSVYLAIPGADSLVRAALPLFAKSHGRPMSAAWNARRTADQAMEEVSTLGRWPGKTLAEARAADVEALAEEQRASGRRFAGSAR